MDQNNIEWADNLKKQVEVILTRAKENSCYSIDLKSIVDLIPNEVRGLPGHGHPISWLIYGTTGMQAFAIGRLAFNISDDGSEKHLLPPVLTQALLSLGEEYSYSQVAIVTSSSHIDAKQSKWLENWLQEHSYIRRVHLYEESIELLAEQIVKIILKPWQTILLADYYLRDNIFSDFTSFEDESLNDEEGDNL